MLYKRILINLQVWVKKSFRVKQVENWGSGCMESRTLFVELAFNYESRKLSKVIGKFLQTQIKTKNFSSLLWKS